MTVRILFALLLASLLCLPSAAGTPLTGQSPRAADQPAAERAGWSWPVARARIVEPFRAPAHAYAEGHRGIDLGAGAGAEVLSPAAGTVVFVGRVAGRPLLTIDHGGGYVTTLEPVEAVVVIGATVGKGQLVGRVAAGGHSAPGAVHFGVRRDGVYVNPLLLLDELPRAVLLPCC